MTRDRPEPRPGAYLIPPRYGLVPLWRVASSLEGCAWSNGTAISMDLGMSMDVRMGIRSAMTASSSLVELSPRRSVRVRVALVGSGPSSPLLAGLVTSHRGAS
jgi:hypothetical protein